MKWFFAYNGLRPAKFDLHIRVMVRSAQANTSLEPHLLYSGEPGDPIVPFAEGHGVRVIHRKSSILPDLQRIKDRFPDYHLLGATGAFLRIDLPTICRDLGYDDEVVLYTDCDVVFARDLPEPSSHAFMRPALFSCGPEGSPPDWSKMNSGVMFMNVVNLAKDLPAFREFITSGDTLYQELYKQGAFDQAAYQLFYDSRWDRLPLEYNWRPYWGFNEEALIVHFHGPKIPHLRRIMSGETDGVPQVMVELYERDPAAYRKYLDYVEPFLSD